MQLTLKGELDNMISSYFITGTGRCGSLMLSKVLDCSKYTHCNHEYSINTGRLKKAFYKNNPGIIAKDIDRLLKHTIIKYNNLGQSYGECSGHLYLVFPELFRRCEYSSRFVLLVRNPIDFVRSALARGFFCPDHPHALEHVVPPKDTAMGLNWCHASPLEKCAWYWATVNGIVLRFFKGLPSSMCRIVRIESIIIEVIKDLYEFLELPDFEDVLAKIEMILKERHNASPGMGNNKYLNPYSKAISLDPMASWSEEDKIAFNRHVRPLQEIIYCSKEINLDENSLCKISL